MEVDRRLIEELGTDADAVAMAEAAGLRYVHDDEPAYVAPAVLAAYRGGELSEGWLPAGGAVGPRSPPPSPWGASARFRLGMGRASSDR